MLKNNRFVRRLALILCLSLIVGLAPAGIWSVPFTVNAVPDGTVVFSDDAEAYNFKSKWTLTGSVMAWSDASYKYQGDRVMLLQTPGDTATSPAFAVTPGMGYTLSYFTKQHTAPATAGKGSVQIRFYNASGVQLTGATVQAPACGVTDWEEKTLTAVAPDGAATARLFFTTEGDAKLIYLVDVMTVTEHAADPDTTTPTQATEATEPADNLVLNAGFEDDSANWIAYLPTEIVNDDVHSGAAAMKVTDANNTSGGYITQSVPVVPGKTYELSAWIKVLEGKNGYMGIYDIGDAAVLTAIGSNSGWTKYTVSVTIPEGFTSAKIEIGGDKRAVTTYLVDDVTFTEVVKDEPEATESTEATESVETLVFEDDIEAYNFKQKWTLTGNTLRWPPNPGFGYQGDYVMILQGGGDTATSPAFAVAPGKVYTLRYMTKQFVAGAAGNVEIRFYNASGAQIGSAAKMEACGAAEFTEKTLTAAAPSGAVSAKIYFDAPGENYVVDVIKVTEGGTVDPDATESTDPTGSTVPSEEPGVGQVVNGGFENGFGGWSEIPMASIYTEDKHSGNSSVLIVDDARDAGGHLSQSFPVTPGKTYKLSVWVKVLSAVADREGYFGIYGIGDAAVACMTGSSPVWKQYSVSVTIPEGYTSVTIEIGSHKGSVTTYLVDDVTFTEVTGEPEETEPTEDTTPTETTEPTEPPVYKESFEEFFTPEGANYLVRIPNGWTASEQTAAIGCAKYDKNYDGSWNLCLQDPANKWMRSPLTEVVPGYEYHVVFHEKKYQPGQPGDGGYVKIVFVDADGKALKEYEIKAGSSKKWTEKTLYSKAPEGAKAFYVEFGLSGPTGEPTFSVDDLAVYAFEASLSSPDVTQPTEPAVVYDPMKPIDEKFETMLHIDSMDAGPAGWYSNDDNSGVFSPMIGLVNDELSIDGNYLILKKAGKWCIQSPEFPVEIGYAYTAEFVARKLMDNEDFFGSVEICFINSRGKVIKTESAPAGKTYGAWTEESVTAVAPLGALKAYVQFKLEYTDRRMDGDYAVDNLVVTRAQEQSFPYTPDPNSTEPTEYKTIYTDSFQSYYKPTNSSKIPHGWTASEQNASMGSATYDSYDGSFNLVLQDRGDKWIKGPMINAKPGNIYYATFVEKKLQPHQEGTGAYVKICFVGEDGKVIKEYKADIGTSKTWTELEVGGQAPAGTVQLYVEFGIAGATGQPSYSVDNLSVIEGVPTKPGQQPSNPGTNNPGDNQSGTPEDNAPTSDNAYLVFAPVVLTASVALVVLILKKRRFF